MIKYNLIVFTLKGAFQYTIFLTTGYLLFFGVDELSHVLKSHNHLVWTDTLLYGCYTSFGKVILYCPYEGCDKKPLTNIGIYSNVRQVVDIFKAPATLLQITLSEGIARESFGKVILYCPHEGCDEKPLSNIGIYSTVRQVVDIFKATATFLQSTLSKGIAREGLAAVVLRL